MGGSLDIYSKKKYDSFIFTSPYKKHHAKKSYCGIAHVRIFKC